MADGRWLESDHLRNVLLDLAGRGHPVVALRRRPAFPGDRDNVDGNADTSRWSANVLTAD